jgi:nuclear pore complex protein Nup205
LLYARDRIVKNNACFLVCVRQVMVYGTEEEAISWIHLLDEDCSVSPCWELLFEAMCCPVPQKLKASLDLAIASLSRHHTIVPQLWERLLAAVVVRRDVFREYGKASMPVKYDLSYQLNEIEARSEEYIEAVAFVELLNSLWRNSSTGLKDCGARFGHFTKFVVEEILSSVYQRSFKSEKERWQLLAKCLVHCGLCLDCMPPEPAGHLGLSGAQTPGEYVMMDLLEERIVFRVMMFTLSLGTEWLSSQSLDDLFAEKAAALVACFQLIKKAMSLDEDFVAKYQGMTGGKVYSKFDFVLLRDRGHLPVLLEYCQVSWDKNLLYEALQVSQQLISRVPNVVSILESLPQSMDGHSVKGRLQQGFRSTLENAHSVPQVMQDDLDRDIAEIGLDIILDSLRSHSPNFAEYICGFDVISTSESMALEDPRFSPTPLLTTLEIISDPAVAGSRPKLYEKCLQAIYSLAANPRTGSVVHVHSFFPCCHPWCCIQVQGICHLTLPFVAFREVFCLFSFFELQWAREYPT